MAARKRETEAGRKEERGKRVFLPLSRSEGESLEMEIDVLRVGCGFRNSSWVSRRAKCDFGIWDRGWRAGFRISKSEIEVEELGVDLGIWDCELEEERQKRGFRSKAWIQTVSLEGRVQDLDSDWRACKAEALRSWIQGVRSGFGLRGLEGQSSEELVFL